MHVTYIFPFDRVLSACQRLSAGVWRQARCTELSGSVYTLFCYRGLEEGETGLGCIVREERVGGERAERLEGN